MKMAEIANTSASRTYADSLVFAAETGWEKDSALYFAAAYTLGTQFSKIEAQQEYLRPGIENGVTIVTPTIALAVEFYSNIRRMFAKYYHAAAACPDLHQTFGDKLPVPKYVQRRNGSLTVRYPCKLTAGNTGTFNLY